MRSQRLLSGDSPQSITKKIFYFQNTLLNQTFSISFIVTLFGITISLLRIPYTGIRTAFFFQFAGVCVLLVMVVLKNKISYWVKVYSFIAIQLLAVIGGMISFGLLAGAGVFLICSCAMAAIFAGKKLTIIVFLTSVLIIAVFAWLFYTDRLECTIDPVVYTHSITSWINLLSAFVMASVLIVALTSALIERLKIMIEESVRNSEEIRALNSTLEQRVEQRTKELSELNKQKDWILGMVAHDINNKLGGLLGYLDLVRNNDIGIDNESRLKFISTAIEAGSDAQSILKDLLEFASNSKEPASLLVDNVDIFAFVSESIESHYPTSLKKGIVITVDQMSTSCYCDINRGKMSRVIDNLLTNALKFTSQGGIITVSIGTLDCDCIIKISDTGIGIPDTLKSVMFTPFSNACRDGTGKEKSNGLGLSISKQIVELHKGTIWFESEEGKGSTFFVKIPRTL